MNSLVGQKEIDAVNARLAVRQVVRALFSEPTATLNAILQHKNDGCCKYDVTCRFVLHHLRLIFNELQLEIASASQSTPSATSLLSFLTTRRDESTRDIVLRFGERYGKEKEKKIVKRSDTRGFSEFNRELIPVPSQVPPFQLRDLQSSPSSDASGDVESHASISVSHTSSDSSAHRSSAPHRYIRKQTAVLHSAAKKFDVNTAEVEEVSRRSRKKVNCSKSSGTADQLPMRVKQLVRESLQEIINDQNVKKCYCSKKLEKRSICSDSEEAQESVPPAIRDKALKEASEKKSVERSKVAANSVSVTVEQSPSSKDMHDLSIGQLPNNCLSAFTKRPTIKVLTMGFDGSVVKDERLKSVLNVGQPEATGDEIGENLIRVPAQISARWSNPEYLRKKDCQKIDRISVLNKPNQTISEEDSNNTFAHISPLPQCS